MRIRPRTVGARRLRRDATDVERRLWYALREKLAPWKFRRQHPIGRRIADFACPARKLAIELDGGQHVDDARADELRTVEIAAHGCRVIRFWNGDINGNLEGVLETIRSELESPHLTPTLSAPRGGEGAAR
jgi:very-short-patch-repair endonuclease